MLPLEATEFFWTLDEAERPLPAGWKATPWLASSKFGDVGWQYKAWNSTQGFAAGKAGWGSETSAFSTVRRRLWHRTFEAPAPSQGSSV